MPVARSSTGHRWGVNHSARSAAFLRQRSSPQPGKSKPLFDRAGSCLCDQQRVSGWNFTGCGIAEGKIDQVQSMRENNGSAIDCLCQALPRFETIFATGIFRALGRPGAPKVTSLFHWNSKTLHMRGSSVPRYLRPVTFV